MTERGHGTDYEAAVGRRHRRNHDGVRRASGRIAPISLGLALVVVVIDQLAKKWAVSSLSDGRELHVVWTLQWNLSYNTGMAFSRAQGFGPLIGLLAVVIVVVLAVSTTHVDTRSARISAGLLIGGALGNLTDRLFRGSGWMRGAVVDFVDFQWFPIFNVADIAVSVGAVLFGLAALSAAPKTVTDASNSMSTGQP